MGPMNPTAASPANHRPQDDQCTGPRSAKLEIIEYLFSRNGAKSKKTKKGGAQLWRLFKTVQRSFRIGEDDDGQESRHRREGNVEI